MNEERLMDIIIWQARQLRWVPYKLWAKDPVAQWKIDCSWLLSYIGNRLWIMDKTHMYRYNAWLLYSLGKRKTVDQTKKWDIIFFLAQNKWIDNHIVIIMWTPKKLDNHRSRVEIIDASLKYWVANRTIDIHLSWSERFYTVYDWEDKYIYKLRFATNPISEYWKYKNVDLESIITKFTPKQAAVQKTAVVSKTPPKQTSLNIKKQSWIFSVWTKKAVILRYWNNWKPICQTFAVKQDMSKFNKRTDFHITQYIPWNWNQINCWWDCKKTANWTYLADNAKSKVWKLAACPRQFGFWTKLEIQWYWIVTCVDRWWLITLKWDINSRCNESSMNRLDVFTGYWKQIAKIPPDNAKVRVVK